MKFEVEAIDLIFPFASDEDEVCLRGVSCAVTIHEPEHLKNWIQSYGVEKIDFQVRIIRSKYDRENSDEDRPEKSRVRLVVHQNESASATMLLMASEVFYKKMLDMAILKPKSCTLNMVEKGANFKDLGGGRFEANIEVGLETIIFGI